MKKFCYLFDLDDTLYREHDYVHSGFRAVADYLANLNSSLDSSTIYQDFVSVWQKHGRGKVFDIVCEKYDLKANIQQLVKVYREHRPKLALYNDAAEVLSFFKNKKVPMGIITDGHPKMQWRKIDSLGLRDLVDIIVVTGDLGSEFWKPSPVPYQNAAKKLGASIHQCIYVGDNPHKDFVTARKLGMGTVRIIRPTGDHMNTTVSLEYEADKIITSLTDLSDEWK